MGLLRLLAYTAIGWGVVMNVWLWSWDLGHDVGYSSGYNQALLEGKLEVVCKGKK